jgi:type IV pilus assembly protein PilM
VPLVCEVAADYVAAVRHHHGRAEAWALRSLPPEAVRPASLAENIADRAALQQALEHVVGAVADGRRRCALLVPDLLARVAVLEFDHLPDRAPEAEALLRWRLGKDLPFDINEAVVSFQAQAGAGGTPDALVAVALRNLLRQYEECLESLGLQPGWVTLSTLAALGGWESSSAPRLLVKRDHGSLSVVIVEDEAVRLFRTLPVPPGDAFDEEALVEKVYPAAVYFQDHWGRPVSEAVLVSVGENRLPSAQRLQRELGCGVTEFSAGAIELPPSALSGAAADTRLAPCWGWVRGGA